MSSLLLKKKSKTFEEICPKWSKQIGDNGFFIPVNREKRLDIANHQFCIVGEAHGFNDDYLTGDYGDNPEKICDECKRTSIRIFESIDSEGNEICRINQEVLEKFVEHFNEMHIK